MASLHTLSVFLGLLVAFICMASSSASEEFDVPDMSEGELTQINALFARLQDEQPPEATFNWLLFIIFTFSAEKNKIQEYLS